MCQTAEELNEENRAVIRRMIEQGDDLSKERGIDFSVVFPDGGSAEAFALQFRGLGYRTSVRQSNAAPGLPWDVTVVKQMLPICEAITEFELLLQAKATPLGGRNDGWGCLQQEPPVLH